MTRKRIPAALAIGLCATVALAGCGGASGADASSDTGKVTLTFANADPAATWQPVIDAYQKDHPDVEIKQLNIPYAQFTSTITQRLTQGNTDLDLFVVDRGWLKDYANRGFVADLSDMHADATAAALTDDIVESNVIDGKLLALEPWTTSQFLYYNVDALEEAGVDLPSSDPAERWTWEQLEDAAQKVKDAGNVEYPLLFNQFDTYYQLQPLGVSAGGGDALADGGSDFSNAGWQRALQYYHDLFEKGLSPRGVTNDKTDALFTGGSAAFIVSGPWTLANSVQADTPFGIAPAPYFEGGTAATSSDSWSVAVSSSSQQQEAAKDFLRYITIDATGNAISAAAAAITPTNAEAYTTYASEASASGGDASAPFGELLEYELKNSAVHRPNESGYTVFESEANKMFSDVRNGTDPATSAQQADETIKAQLERLG